MEESCEEGDGGIRFAVALREMKELLLEVIVVQHNAHLVLPVYLFDFSSQCNHPFKPLMCCAVGVLCIYSTGVEKALESSANGSDAIAVLPKQ